ncbi:host cell division inhibitor Icd-like protein [Providencia rettgeri]|uniref:host cell division inhibitor Icd-like protein n=1 Tax=Providencia rettgeri TaxID=587 RepID=UPI001E5E2291|nr:host cell division inhibitor Icd-like protein [Providencia rettgeri]
MLAYQGNISFLAGNQSDKLSSGYSVNILAQQLAKTLADVSVKIYANQSPKFTGYQSAKHFANLLIQSSIGGRAIKRGEFTPLAKGDFSHLSKVGKSHYLSSVIEFLESIKKGSQSATLGDVDIKYRASENINISLLLWYGKYQLLGSIPRLSNSLRRSRLIQPALLSSPSSIMALVRRSDKSASKRSCTTILSFWFSLVDIGVHPYILNLLNGNVHHCIPLSKAMPRSGGTLTGHLITTDSIIIEVTMSKHITPFTGRTSLTPNQSFRWLFLALNRSDYTAKPCRIAVTAPNENSARLMLVRDYMLIFAGRLPAIGGNHHA